MVNDILSALGISEHQLKTVDENAFEAWERLKTVESRINEGISSINTDKIFQSSFRELVNYLKSEEFKEKLKTVGVYQEDMEEIELPELPDLDDLDLPEVEETTETEEIELPELPNLDDLDLPDLDAPEVEETTETEEIELPELPELPDLDDLGLPDLDAPEVEVPAPALEDALFFVAKSSISQEIKEGDSVALNVLLGAGEFSPKKSLRKDITKQEYFLSLPKLKGFIKFETQNIFDEDENIEIDQLIHKAFETKADFYAMSIDEGMFEYMLSVLDTASKNLAENEILSEDEALLVVNKNDTTDLFSEISYNRNTLESYVRTANAILEKNKNFRNAIEFGDDFFEQYSGTGVTNPNNYLVAKLYIPSEEAYYKGGTYRNFGKKNMLYTPNNSKFTFYESSPKNINTKEKKFAKKGADVKINKDAITDVYVYTLNGDKIFLSNSESKMIVLDLFIYNYFNKYYPQLDYKFIDTTQFKGLLMYSEGELVGAKPIPNSQILVYTNDSAFGDDNPPFNFTWDKTILSSEMIDVYGDDRLKKIIPNFDLGLQTHIIEAVPIDDAGMSEEAQKVQDYIDTLESTLEFYEDNTEEKIALEDYIETLKSFQ